MSEESHSDTLAFMSSFDDSRDVCHHERLVVVVAYDAEVRLQSRERVVRDLRTGCRYSREKGRLSGVRETYESYVSEELELEDEPAFFERLSRLRVTRRLVGRCLEVVVSKSSAASLHKDSLLIWFNHLE